MADTYTPVQGTAEQINTPGYVSAYKVDPSTGLPYGGIPSLGEKVVDDTSDVSKEYSDMDKGLTNLGMDASYDDIVKRVLGEDAGSVTSSMDIPDPSGIGEMGDSDRQRIEEAGRTAGYQYDPLINQAQEQKRQGMPKAVIAAGERGGFMNTQFSGRAALQSTEGGDFIGAGGQLESIKSAYDLNISNLQVQKSRAIAEAKSNMQNFITTGQQRDFDNAVTKYKLAQDAAAQQQAMINDKLNTMIKWSQYMQEVNKPVLTASEAIQTQVFDWMDKFPGAFKDETAESLSKMTLNEAYKKVTESEEFKQGGFGTDLDSTDYKEFKEMVARGEIEDNWLKYKQLKATQYGTENSSTTEKPEDQITAFLQTGLGEDGYTEPDDFKAARDAWVEDGLSIKEFYEKFGHLLNSKDKKRYDIIEKEYGRYIKGA